MSSSSPPHWFPGCPPHPLCPHLVLLTGSLVVLLILILYVLIQSSSLVPWLSSSSSSSFGSFQLLQFHWNRKKSLYTFRFISPFTFIHSPCQSLPILFNIIIFSYSYDSFPFHIPFPFLFSYGLSVLLPYSFLTCQYIYIFTECLVLGIIFAI